MGLGGAREGAGEGEAARRAPPGPRAGRPEGPPSAAEPEGPARAGLGQLVRERRHHRPRAGLLREGGIE